MHVGVVGPIHIQSLKRSIKGDVSNWVCGMGGTPVNHQINALLEAGHRVSVFSLSPEINVGESFEWHQDNLSIFLGPFRKRARRRCADLFLIERTFLKKSMLAANPQLIHAHWQYEWAWAALDSKIPTLVTCHDSPIRVLRTQMDLYRLIRLIMSIIVLKRAKYVSAVSPYTASSLTRLTKAHIDIVPNFEPDYVFDLYETVSKGNQFRVAMINNGFSGRKNVAIGIRTFVQFQKLYPQAELHLYGKGHGLNEDAHLWYKEQKYEINIHFNGDMNFEDLMIDVSKSHVLMHTSLEESCPMVVIEAFALGMPVIGGDKSGGMPWMIEEGSGCLVNVENVESILSGLIHLFKSENYARYSKHARESALRRFSKNPVMAQYTNLYSTVLEGYYGPV